ncbi:glutamate synthase subunit beta [Chrysiogenes arsenatis]|uniref:glutamate synthase subunit beta n=1 Tax=Chrysiogenes arsenatis TaxID=309797 RepID=UPI00040878E0|nr:glutamate synthase subunit beta [Chrysiogenes arsenatis]
MQSFININRSEPKKTEVKERVKHFDEIYTLYNRSKLAQQADRCVQCGDPFCSANGCPLSNAIPQWLLAIAGNDLKKAFLLSNETSPFPEILGRVCPQANLCEGACTLADGYGAITIGSIEATITDLAFQQGLSIEFPPLRPNLKVAVVGSGPASMSAAHFLLRAGIKVEMFERADRAGGLLTYGIPGFKLSKDIVDSRIELLKKAGMVLHLGTTIGVDLSLKHLHDSFDAVFLGVGATGGKRSGLTNEDHPSVFIAMEYLTHIQKKLFGMDSDPRFSVKGKKVVVIGGGDTAMDCLRTAVREGAESVKCLYRRDEVNMPGSPKEYINAREEGVGFLFNASPRKIELGKQGDIAGVELVRTRLGKPGEDGRAQIEEIPRSEFCAPADVVILALGFDIESVSYLSEVGVEVNRWGQVVVDAQTGKTSNPKIYAGGDCQRGADLVVTAARDGRQAALAITLELLGNN